jgi:hypothetical protein
MNSFCGKLQIKVQQYGFAGHYKKLQIKTICLFLFPIIYNMVKKLELFILEQIHPFHGFY